jgi:hypothetical protein
MTTPSPTPPAAELDEARPWTEEEKLLHDIQKAEGSDAYRSKGKAPVMTAMLWDLLDEFLAKPGFITMDASEAPLLRTKAGTLVGRGFVSLTDTGREMLRARAALDAVRKGGA